MKSGEILVKVMCHNCLHETLAVRDAKGVTKYQCKNCGTITVSKLISRRKIVLELTAPQGQVIMDEIN